MFVKRKNILLCYVFSLITMSVPLQRNVKYLITARKVCSADDIVNEKGAVGIGEIRETDMGERFFCCS